MLSESAKDFLQSDDFPVLRAARNDAIIAGHGAVVRLDVFGSSLREDFNGESDVDLLYVFDEAAQIGLLELVRLREELAALLGRDVDLLSRKAVEQSRNWIRRREILSSAEAIYEPVLEGIPPRE